MAIAHDANATASASWPASSISWSHTCTGSNLLLLVGVSDTVDWTTQSAFPTGTYGSQSLTKIQTKQTNNTSNTGICGQWGLIAPSTGTHTITVTGASGTQAQWQAGSDSYTGCDQTTGWTNLTTSFGNSTTVSGTLASVASGDWSNAVCGAYDVLTSTAGTSRWNQSGGSGGEGQTGAGADSSSSGSVTISWTQASTQFWSWCAVELIAAGGGAAFYPFKRINTVPIRRAANW